MEEATEIARHEVLLAAYWLHIVVPVFLLLDILFAWARSSIAFRGWNSDTLLILVAGLWLLAGTGAYLLARDRKGFLLHMAGPLTAVYTFYFCVFLLELFLRVALPPPNPVPALRPPGTRVTHETISGQMPGISGRKTFTVNERGLRGPSFPEHANIYKVVAIGGSTTECAALDDTEEWPHLIMERMNQGQKKVSVWVANAGVSGQTTVDHLVLMQTLPVIRQLNLLIFLIGVNDLGATLAFQGAPTEGHLEREAADFRQYLLAGARPQYRFPLYKRLAVFGLAKKASLTLARKIHPGAQQQPWLDLTNVRRRRARAKRLPLPDLRVGTQEYQQHVWRLAKQCQSLHLRCLFLTQPSLWRGDLTPGERRLLWWGNIGRWEKPEGYASATDLARAMEAYNQALLAVCRQGHLECYDLASIIPKDTLAFYDDQHFNEEGARIVARQLVDYLLSRPPFTDSGQPAGSRTP